MKIFLSNLIVWCSLLQLHAENGHQLWLRPHAKSPVKIICSSTSPTLAIARRELQDGWQGQPRATVVLSLSKDKIIKGDGFRLEPNKIEANTEAGILYGVYELLRRQETGQPISEELCNPSYERRMLDHWDNPDGSIERGYAGKSIFWRKENPFVVTDSDRIRWREYARADASVGINGAVLNNVNASILMLSADYLARTKAIADVLRPYGVRTYLSVRFSSPIQIAGLKTADPLDAGVIAWWKEKVREIYHLIPDFGGFLVKANSEGQPGPQDYGRTHADGANMLADIIKPYGGIIMWRAFVYNASGKDRAKEAYTEFTPLDGQFRSNVILQVKNGPVDFQPREPFSPLFGAMKKTAVMPEFQITQEYLGQAIHLVFLAPTWEECLKSDTWQEGAGSTVGRCTDGSLYPQQHTAIAGVANIGLDTNWTGHPFAQANWYAFGRLAWNNRLTSDQIADEWLRLTFHPADSGAIVNEALWVTNFLRPVKEMMLQSREAAVNYMMPLGLHHLFSANEHYGPGPWWAPKRVRADWTPPYYHKADTAGIGFDRTDNGSGAVDQYHEPLRSLFNDVATCPDIYLLWFHHLPWTYRMPGGRSLWEDLCYHYDAGVRQVRTFQDIWDRVQPYVDPEQFALVQSKLRSQSENAQLWKDACLLYFQQFSRQPIPYDIERPVHDLDEIIREDMRPGATRTRPASGAIRVRPATTTGAQAATPIRIWPTTPTRPTPPAGTEGEPRSRSMAPSVHADNGDGTFTNPVIMADFPDPDVIRVKDTYYMLTTTMFTFPGVPLLQSHDLVNWSYCNNIVKRMDESPCYNLDGCNRYGHGQWAGSLKYHNGLFYVLFNTLNEGAFLCTAADPSGKWNIRRLGRGFHDCGLLFDDNGKIYVASGYGKLYITELDNNFTPVSKDSLVFKGDLRGGLEGSHAYHLNGYYYLYCTYGGADGFQVALRSKSIWGPYEEKIVIRETDHDNVNFGIHQGALIQTQTGEWWTMLFIDKGPFGRFPSLQPVTWQDGWPVAGVDGKAVVTYKKPDVGAVYPVADLPASDEFTTDTLGMQWSWNHNPDPENWSLTARPGYLRLSTVSPVPNLPWARNTLTQRALANYDPSVPTIATTKLDVEQMKDGDVAGLCVFQDPYAYIGVRQIGDVRTLVMVNNGATVDSLPLGSGTVYLRTSASNGSKKAIFEYSLDNKTFTPLGNDLAMRFSLKIFTGNKFCLFNYATKTTGGYVDFDWFHMDQHRPDNTAAIPFLKETYRDDFLIGTAINAGQIEGRDPRADSLIREQFNAVTPENVMKAALIHPGWDTYRFDEADKLVAYAEKNHLRINAHNLIWHSQLPAFMRHMSNADSVRQYFVAHITTVAKRYDGKVYSWDVVNEALNEDGTLRNSIFLQKLGPGYIVEAFRLAQQAAPHTQLYYNDYGIENPAKRAGAIRIIKEIQAAGVRIDAVGIQGHWHLGKVPFKEIAESIDAFSALGIKVMFTELDISVLPNPLRGNTADVNARAAGSPAGVTGAAGPGDAGTAVANSYPDGLPDSLQQKLAADYAALFKLFLQHKDQVSRVTLWGVDDGASWLNNWPVRGRTNYPLLFDRNYAPKKAFYGVIDAARQSSTHAVGHPSPTTPNMPPSSAGPQAFYNSVHTYVNPVLPGDHPDPTLLKVGEDFYHCGSSFHFNPYLPVYHSKDLVHWEVIARVVPPAVAASFVTDRPSGGIWQGAITYFYGSFWIYFSANGQWFCKAASPYGPWSEPVRVKTNPATGNLGYDNSIFVDDDGKPYMVIKNGQKVNRIQALGRDGQLTDTVINLDWINANLQFSWAEGPVMCKRHGYYYYFPAGDVSGGQYVLRTKKLISDSTYWERLGDFFRPVTDPREGFRRPNHISAPIQLADGTWWTLGQSYEKYAADDWSGTGRQTSLYPVVWEGDRPWGLAPTTQPIVKPDLPQSGIQWTSAQGDDFNKEVLGLQWHFLNRNAARNYSLTTRRGWLRLTPDSGRTHLVQKETDHDYTAVTKVDLHAADTAAKAGIYLTNGNQHVTARLYTGYDNGQRIVFRLDTALRSVANTAGNIVWLKLERKGHALSGYYSGNGATWISLGAPISSAGLDETQPNFNSWVGASIGVFAEGRPADFDFFICKDAFSPLTTAGYANYYGITTIDKANEKFVTNTSPDGGWLMLSGVETGDHPAVAVELTTAATAAGQLEIWLDDLQRGTLAAIVPIRSTGGEDQWRTFSVPVKHFKGHHDVFIKYPAGGEGTIYIRSIRFIPDGAASLIPAPPHTAGTEATLGSGTHTFRYTNPITRDTSISMRDHCIIKVGAKWYCVGTSNPVWTGHNPGVRLLVSDDCLHWRQQGWLIDAATLPPDCPYNGRFWAPEIHNIKNKYWLTINSGRVTAEDPKGMKHHSVWLFSSDSVAGPYRLVNGPLTPQYNNDATLFEDEDGQTYLYCSGNGLFQARIDLSTGKLVGNIQKFLDKRSPGNPDWMFGGIEGPFVIKHEGVYYMFFSTWTRGYEVGLLKAPSPLGPWVLASREPIFGTRKKGYRPELAASGGYADLQFQDSEDPYCETGHNALFEGPDGKLWSSCHYMMYEKRPYPYSQTFEPWELTPQLGIEPVYFENGLFHIKGPTWTEQIIQF